MNDKRSATPVPEDPEAHRTLLQSIRDTVNGADAKAFRQTILNLTNASFALTECVKTLSDCVRQNTSATRELNANLELHNSATRELIVLLLNERQKKSEGSDFGG